MAINSRFALSGRVKQMAPAAPTLVLKTDEPIKGGTSGGPVVAVDGLLLGLASWAGGTERNGGSMGSIPRPHLTAPVWLARQMADAAAEKQAAARRH